MFAPSFSPHDTTTAFLAVDMGLTLRTTNSFQTWTTVDFDQLQGKQFTEVQFTSSTGVLFAADQSRNATESTISRPLRSSDNGDTWQTFSKWPSSQRAISLHASPLRSDTFLVCTGGSILFYRSSPSDTAGLSGNFTAAHTVNGTQGRVAGVFWETTAQEKCWVATNQGLLYSTNGGQSFSASSGPPTAEAMCSFAGGRDPVSGQIRFYAVTTNATVGAQTTPQGVSNSTGHVWRLDPGASNWVDATGNLTGTERPTIVAMSRNNADVAYVAVNRPSSYPDSCAVWRASSAGAPWENIFLTPGNGNILTGWIGQTQRTGPTAKTLESDLSYAAPCGLAVHPTQAGRVLFCDNAQIALSTNADTATPGWQQVYTTADNTGHAPGQLIPNGQSYLSNGLEVTVCTQLDFCGGGVVQAAMLDVQMAISTDGGKRWGWPFDHTTLGGGDVNSVAHDPLTGTRYAAAAFTNTAYEYLGCDDAHTDSTGQAAKPAPGVYYQAPGETVWHALKTDFGVSPGQRGANPVSLTFDPAARKLYVSVVSSNASKDGIHVYDATAATWNKLLPPLRNGTAVQHPYTVSVLPDGALVASYCAHQVGDASVSPATLSNGAYKPTSGVFYLANGTTAWTDCTKNEMRYFTRDLVVDPHDATGRTWFACVWNTDSNVVTPVAAGDTPASWGGLYRTTDAGANWTPIWSGNSTFSGSATSCTIHPEAALKDELLLTTRFGGLWITQNAHATPPVFTRVDSYRFRAPERVYYDPSNHDKIWVTSCGNGIVEGVRPTNFGEWRTRWFGNQSTDDSIAGPQADPDGDGKPNVLEYTTLGDPLSTGFASMSFGLSPTPALSFQRNTAASDATYTVEGSSDLVSWQ
ncbi:MAG: WD40/YVTN/BNR-like repeat-containing protein, partial [Verrucomicrobiota bacterium]